MPAQGRLGDKGHVPACVHGCPACPHLAVGPAITGSPDVRCDGRPALRVGDRGVHAACCGANTWSATEGARTVMINNRPAHRMHDAQQHCGGQGRLIEGSPTVMVDDADGAPSTRSISPAQLELRVGTSAGAPARGARFAVTLPDGAIVRGTADGNGVIKIAGLAQRGACLVELPDTGVTLMAMIGTAQRITLPA